MSATNSNKGLNAVIIVLGIFAVGGTVYLIIQNSAANVGVNTSNNSLTTPSASQSAAASQAAITKAATTTTTSTSGVSGLSSLGTSLINLGKDVASKLTGSKSSSSPTTSSVSLPDTMNTVAALGNEDIIPTTTVPSQTDIAVPTTLPSTSIPGFAMTPNTPATTTPDIVNTDNFNTTTPAVDTFSQITPIDYNLNPDYTSSI